MTNLHRHKMFIKILASLMPIAYIIFYLIFFPSYGEINEKENYKTCNMWPRANPGVDAVCGLTLLLVVVLALRGLSPNTSCFPLSSKTNISKFQFDLNRVAEENVPLLIPISFSISIFFILHNVWLNLDNTCLTNFHTSSLIFPTHHMARIETSSASLFN